MIIRRWDPSTGDIATRGTQFLSGKNAVGAAIYHRLRMFFGEYFLDISDGTPWFQSILGKKPQDTAEAVIKERIVTAPGVYALTSFSFDMDRETRKITIRASVLTDENAEAEIIVEGNIDPGPPPPPDNDNTADQLYPNQNVYIVDQFNGGTMFVNQFTYTVA